MGCTASKKSSTRPFSPRLPKSSSLPTQESLLQPLSPRTDPSITTAVTNYPTNNVATLAPVALLFEGKETALQGEADEGKSTREKLFIGSKDLWKKKRPVRSEQDEKNGENPTEMPLIKDVTHSKQSFDPDKFRKANQSVPPSLSTLPAALQDQLDEVHLFGTVDDLSRKPTSSLWLQSMPSNPFTGSGQPILVQPVLKEGGSVSGGDTLGGGLDEYAGRLERISDC